MDLLAIADFNLVASHGGVGRASRATGRPKATLSRRVVELEESLGVRLFERGKRDLRLTEEGRALHERTTVLLSEIAQVTEDIASRLPAVYPEVQLELVIEDRSVDLVEEGYDLAIRINPRPDETLVGKRFLRDELLMVAAPDFPRPPRKGKGAGLVRAVTL